MTATQIQTLQPKSYEYSFAKKIEARGGPLIKTFQKLDINDDGHICKSDLRYGLGEHFDILLTDEQIECIFQRAKTFDTTPILESREETPDDAYMNFPTFQKYIVNTSRDSSIPQSKRYGAHSEITRPVREKSTVSVDKRSKVAKTKSLRLLALRLIQQSVPKKFLSSGMLDTHSFLQIGKAQDSYVTIDELKQWFESRHGESLTDDEMEMIVGEWYHEDGMTFTQYAHFIDGLEKQTTFEPCNYFTREGVDSMKKYSSARSKDAAKKRELRQKALRSIQQSVPQKDIASGMLDTSSFLKIDKVHDNFVTMDELKQWLNKHRGVDFTEDEMKLMMGEWYHEEGMAFAQYAFFLDGLEKQTTLEANKFFSREDVDSTKKNSSLRSRDAPKTRELRLKALRLIQQSVPQKDIASGMLDTSSFLKIDKIQDNFITIEELKQWLNKHRGIGFTDEEMKIIVGEWYNEAGMSFRQYAHFLDGLEKQATLERGNYFSREDVDSMKEFSVTRSKASHDHMSDKDFIIALLFHFRAIGRTYVKGFNYLRRSTLSKPKLGPNEISAGLKETGLQVSPSRCELLMKDFVGDDGELDLSGFVRMLTSLKK